MKVGQTTKNNEREIERKGRNTLQHIHPKLMMQDSGKYKKKLYQTQVEKTVKRDYILKVKINYHTLVVCVSIWMWNERIRQHYLVADILVQEIKEIKKCGLGKIRLGRLMNVLLVIKRMVSRRMKENFRTWKGKMKWLE